MSTHQLPSSAVPERRSAGFHPSVWGDYFLSYASCQKMELDDTVGKQLELEELKDRVKRTFEGAAADDRPMDELLNLIDHIQRLGIGYHFEKEIDGALERIHNKISCESVDGAKCASDLHTTALMFRLLRQQGYRIPCDVFTKFKGPEGNFNESLKTDARGLLSLYEASHLRVHGEEILDEALAFSLSHLNSVKEKLSPPLRDEISRALNHCIHKGLTRLEAWHYIKLYDQDASHSEVLLKLAKLDFNMLQKLHQKELSEIARWSKDHLNVERNFPYARDRVVELYFWILGVYFEPQFSLARAILTKVISLISIMDDTYDVYGTPEELQLLTDAIDRWDVGAIDQLPHYLQIFYKQLLDTYGEIEEKLAQQGRTYRFIYAKEAMQNQARTYFKEAKWFHDNYIPMIEEYIPLALETSGHGTLAISSFIGMGDVASKESFEWMLSDPKIVRGSKLIGRFMDDIVSHKFEQKRGHVASAIECYVKHHGITEQEAEKIMWKMIDDAWKDINEECLQPTPVPASLLMRILNLTRVLEYIYAGKDAYTHSQTETKEAVTALLVNPVPL